MHSVLTILSVLVLSFFSSILDVRTSFASAHTSKQNAIAFYNQTTNLADASVSAKAYQAAGKMIQSKFESNKKNKKEYFKQGALALNDLIEKNPNHIEARFVRLVIQQNTPAILKYNVNIKEDKKIVLNGFANADANVKSLIKNYITSSKKFSEQEINNLK